MAMTRDRDWYTLLSDQDVAFPDSSTLVQRVQIHNDIYEDNSVVRLRLKGRDQKTITEEKLQIAELGRAIGGRTSLLVYLFGHDQEPNQSQMLQNAIEDLSNRLSSVSYRQEYQTPSSMPGNPDRLLILDDLLRLLQGEFSYEHMQEESIPFFWKQLNILRAYQPSRTKIECLLRLGHALQRRYARLHLIDDLEDAIHCYYQAAFLSSGLTFGVHRQQLDANLGLASSIYQRYLVNGQLGDLITLKSTLEKRKDFDVKTMLRPLEIQLSKNKVYGGNEERKRQDELKTEVRNPPPTFKVSGEGTIRPPAVGGGIAKLFTNIINGFKRPLKLTSGGQLSPTDIIIVLIGATGSGKSTFISKFTGDKSKIGSDGSLEPCTASVKITKCFSDSLNSSIVFMDTPGFNGEDMHDGLIMVDISNLLREMSKKGLRLSGLLYLHKISDNRLGLGPRRALKAISKGSGLNESNVILVTTLWDTAQKTEAEAREARLREDYQWGGRTSRFSRELPDEEVFQIIKPLITGEL